MPTDTTPSSTDPAQTNPPSTDPTKPPVGDYTVAAPSPPPEPDPTFDLPALERFFLLHLDRGLPAKAYLGLDTHRLTTLHFAVNGLALLGRSFSDDERERIKDFVYFHQNGGGGFSGGGMFYCSPEGPRSPERADSPEGAGSPEGADSNAAEPMHRRDDHSPAHLANLYSGLTSLLAVGDDLSGVNRLSTGRWLRSLQRPDGSFRCGREEDVLSVGGGGGSLADVTGVCSVVGRDGGVLPDAADLDAADLDAADGDFCASEHDLRMTFCAAAAAHMLRLWEFLDVRAMVGRILRCRAYDGAFGMGEWAEAHGGATYCAVAALVLAVMGPLAEVEGSLEGTGRSSAETGGASAVEVAVSAPETDRILTWCRRRQRTRVAGDARFAGGFQGRVGKLTDPCYTFWVGGTIAILEALSVRARRRLEGLLQSARRGTEARPPLRRLGDAGRTSAEASSAFDVDAKDHSSSAEPSVIPDARRCRCFLKRCFFQHHLHGPQTEDAFGFSKGPQISFPDLLHTFMGVCGLSLCGGPCAEEGERGGGLYPLLGITTEAAARLERIRDGWSGLTS